MYTINWQACTKLPVLELDRTIEFHRETPISFAALVTHMQIANRFPFTPLKTEYSRIIPNPQIQFCSLCHLLIAHTYTVHFLTTSLHRKREDAESIFK